MANGDELTADEPVLYRQIRSHPKYVDEAGRLRSSAFMPGKKDEGRLSVDRSSMTNLESSARHFESNFKESPHGTVGLTVRQCHDAAAQHETVLVVRHEPVSGNEAHAGIDFSAMSRNRSRNVAKLLKVFAAEGGWLYPPGLIGTDAQ